MLYLYGMWYSLALYVNLLERLYEYEEREKRNIFRHLKDGSPEFLVAQKKKIMQNEIYQAQQEMKRLEMKRLEREKEEREKEEREREEREREIQERNDEYIKSMQNDVWYGLPEYH